MFERSLKLSLHIPKRFNAFQGLKWLSLHLEVTCVIFARATNTDVWQAVVARASLRKTVVSHLKHAHMGKPLTPVRNWTDSSMFSDDRRIKESAGREQSPSSF